jgi:hypothetical protein
MILASVVLSNMKLRRSFAFDEDATQGPGHSGGVSSLRGKQRLAEYECYPQRGRSHQARLGEAGHWFLKRTDKEA